MPLPFLPAIFIAVSALAGVKGAVDAVSAGLQIPALQQDYDERRIRYYYCESGYKTARRRVEQRLNDLGSLRLEALVTLGKAVDFLKKAKIKERMLTEELHISQEQLAEWEGATLHAIDVLQGVATGIGAGAAAGSTAYGLAGALGAASTGTAIASLSGAAATNATLAWLGGGALAAGGGGMALGTAVLGGLVAGPALLVGGFFISSKVEQVKTAVAKQTAAMHVAEAQMKQQIAAFRAIHARIDELKISIQHVQTALKAVLANAKPDNLEEVFEVAKIANSLAKLLDIKALNDNALTTK